MATIDKMATDGTFKNMSKRERLQITRQRLKLEKNLGSITDLTRLPAALFVVDISKESIAVHEAQRLNIPIFAIVDTNSDPNEVDFAIPANDDASKSISLIINILCKAMREGLEERKIEREKEAAITEKNEQKEEIDDETYEEQAGLLKQIDDIDLEGEITREDIRAIKKESKKSPAKKLKQE